MEKIMYHAWKPGVQSSEDFRDALTQQLSAQLQQLGVRAYRVCVDVGALKRASSIRLVNTEPQPDAVLSLWVDSANDYYRQPYDEAIQAATERCHAYLVAESEPMPNTQFPAKLGERVHGMTQIVFLQVPDWIDYDQWMAIWRNSHTAVAIGTQSTFSYRQNTVLRALSYAAPHYDAFIEESFPEESLYSDEHYYDQQAEKAEPWDAIVDQCFPEAIAVRKNPELTSRWQINATIMQESVMRFIDIGQNPYAQTKIDCMPFSEYILKSL